MNVIYGVTKGCYDDYCVLGIFSDKTKAEVFAASIRDSSVEEFPWDPSPDERRISVLLSLEGDSLWKVFMDLSGNVDTEPWTVDIEEKYGFDTLNHIRTIGAEPSLGAVVRADSAESAIKIMNDYRLRHINEGLKGESID